MSDEINKLDTNNELVLQSAHTMLLYCVILAGTYVTVFYLFLGYSTEVQVQLIYGDIKDI